MHRPVILILLIFFFFACRNEAVKTKEFSETERDKVIRITTINGAEDTLFQIRNVTQGSLKIYYKGDSIFLLQDSSCFSNKNYMLTEQNGTTTLLKNNKIIFQNPVKY